MITETQKFLAEQMIKLAIASDRINAESPYKVVKFYLEQAKELEQELIKDHSLVRNDFREKISEAIGWKSILPQGSQTIEESEKFAVCRVSIDDIWIIKKSNPKVFRVVEENKPMGRYSVYDHNNSIRDISNNMWSLVDNYKNVMQNEFRD
jgi:hypothetical protein